MGWKGTIYVSREKIIKELNAHPWELLPDQLLEEVAAAVLYASDHVIINGCGKDPDYESSATGY